jgi:tetratricopeptide (TPR) repeat protein
VIYQGLLEGQEGLSDVDAWIGLGNIAYMLDDYNALRRCASRVVAIAPARPDGYSLWALWHRENNDHRQALAAIDRAIAAEPSNPTTHAFRGVLLTDIGQRREAIDAFTDAVTLAPANPGYRAMLEQAEAGTFASVPTLTD